MQSRGQAASVHTLCSERIKEISLTPKPAYHRRAFLLGYSAVQSLKILCAVLLLLVPWVCSAKCTTAATVLKVKIEASESDKQRLVRDLKERGCNRGLVIEPIDEGFDYRISLADVLKPRMTLTQAGAGSAQEAVLKTTVFDGKGTVLFEFDRGNRLTRKGVLNASAKEIVKRLIPLVPSVD